LAEFCLVSVVNGMEDIPTYGHDGVNYI